MDKIRALLEKHRDLVAYLLFGGLTTAVDWGVYFPLYNLCALSATLAGVIAWAASVLFAFLTNKPFVFRSHDWSWKVVWPELTKFVGTRLGSLLLQEVILLATVDCLHWNGNVMKVLVSVAVVIVNYLGSKWLVFRKKQKNA